MNHNKQNLNKKNLVLLQAPQDQSSNQQIQSEQPKAPQESDGQQQKKKRRGLDVELIWSNRALDAK